MAYLKGIGLDTSTALFSKRTRRGTALGSLPLFMQKAQEMVQAGAKAITSAGLATPPPTATVTPTTDGGAAVSYSASPGFGSSKLMYVGAAAVAGVGLFLYLRKRK